MLINESEVALISHQRDIRAYEPSPIPSVQFSVLLHQCPPTAGPASCHMFPVTRAPSSHVSVGLRDPLTISNQRRRSSVTLTEAAICATRFGAECNRSRRRWGKRCCGCAGTDRRRAATRRVQSAAPPPTPQSLSCSLRNLKDCLI